MKIGTILTSLVLLFSHSIGANQKETCQHTPTSFQCVKYIKNYDGDTITFNIPNTHPLLGKKIAIRVNGINAAEIRTKNECEKRKARVARKLVGNLIKRAKRIDLINIKRGKYFRVIADVIFDGRNLAEVMMKNKLAYPYYGGRKIANHNWCK